MLPDERTDRDRETIFLKVNDLTSLTSQKYPTGKKKITCIFLSLPVLFVGIIWFFMRMNFVRTKLRFALKPSNIPENVAFEETVILLN